MRDLEIERYRLKASIHKTEDNLLKQWGRFRDSITLMNATDLIGQQLLPSSYLRIKSGFSQAGKLWNGLLANVFERIVSKIFSKK